MNETIGGYAILNEIGSGGFGKVYRAYGMSSGRAVALKTLNPKLADPNVIERFRRESLLTAEINHPNVIRILDEGEDGGTRFIVMEMMRLSLRDALSAAGILLISRAMDICRQAALGLKAAHDRDIIHRDVKPENILIDSNGSVKVADFGIAHADELPSLTATGVGIGTRRYMSPEQFKDSRRVDARADIYSLGVTLYEMLTGNCCDLGESARISRPAIPAELDRIVNKCIETDRERRYESADDLIQEISNPALINRCALIDFYEATGGDNWHRNHNWLTDAPLDDWEGVEANPDGVVVGLDASENNLVGRIPAEIAHLTELEVILLIDNRLSGSIPPELGNLTELDELFLAGNRLSGSIPPELGNLTKLYCLSIGENRLSGSIPPELGNLTKLSILMIDDNCLSGSIPPELGSLPKGVSLYLSKNNWTGCIPRAVFNIMPDGDLDKIDLPICED